MTTNEWIKLAIIELTASEHFYRDCASDALQNGQNKTAMAYDAVANRIKDLIKKVPK